MKKTFFTIVIIICIGVLLFLGFGYLSSYIGWYGYRKWLHRVATTDILDSKQRGVFIKDLNYEIDSFPKGINNFHPYIEKGFRYGFNSSNETRPIENSKYPYTLNFDQQPVKDVFVFIKRDELVKFDSTDGVWGYLKFPTLKDTIILEIRGENIHSGIIRIWEGNK